MTRGLGIVGAAAFVVALTLAPRSADAQLIAGADYQCVVPQSVNAGTAFSFQPSMGGVNFGSEITPSGPPPFGSFILNQVGIYQIHLSGRFNFSSYPIIQAVLNGIAPVAQWITFVNLGGSDIGFVGERLISVAAANSSLSLIPIGQASLVQNQNYWCELVITQVAFPPPPPPMSGPPLTSAPSIMRWRQH
jgi:hypothetical protein